MTLDEIAALEALRVESMTTSGAMERLKAIFVLDSALERHLPALLALARRALEADARPDADDVRDMAAAECRKLAEMPPRWHGDPHSNWHDACHACAERIEAMEVRVVSRLVLSDTGAAP